MPPSDLDTSAPSTETPEMPAGFPDGSTPEARRPHRATPPRVMLLWAGWRPGPWTGAALEGSGWHVTAAHPSDGGHAWSGSEGGLVRYPDPAHDEVVAEAAELDGAGGGGAGSDRGWCAS